MLSVRIDYGTHIKCGPEYLKTHLALLLLGPSRQRGRVNQLEGERVRNTSEFRHSWGLNILSGVTLCSLLIDLGSAVPRVRSDPYDAS